MKRALQSKRLAKKPKPPTSSESSFQEEESQEEESQEEKEEEAKEKEEEKEETEESSEEERSNPADERGLKESPIETTELRDPKPWQRRQGHKQWHWAIEWPVTRPSRA